MQLVTKSRFLHPSFSESLLSIYTLKLKQTALNQNDMRITHNQNLNNLMAQLVTEVALAFPIKAISNISFYSGNKLLGTCSWHYSKYKMQLMHQLYENIESTFILFDSVTENKPTQAKISGMDFDDFPFSLFVPFEYTSKKVLFD